MTYTVVKPVGWLQGLNGKGVVYELSGDDGTKVLGMLQKDVAGGEFWAFLSYSTLKEHIEMGKGKSFVSNVYPEAPAGFPFVVNANGWQRLYMEPTTTVGGTDGDSTEGDTIEIPVSVSFEGKMKIRLGGLEKLMQLFE